MKDRIVVSMPCCTCGKNAVKEIRWFASGSRNYLCLAKCADHGWLKGKNRMKKTENGDFFCVKTLKLVSDAEAETIIQKKEALKQKQKRCRKEE